MFSVRAAFTPATSHRPGMNVEPFDGDLQPLSGSIAAWPFKPYRWARVPPDKLDALILARFRQNIEREGTRTWMATAAEGCCGFGMLEPLAWDSRMLGRSAARAEFVVTGDYGCRRTAVGGLLDTILSEAGGSHIEHLSVRVDAADDAVIHALEAAGFLSVDALVTFERPVAEARAGEPSSLTLREVQPADLAAVEGIAASSFVDGRFHTDPSIDHGVAAAVYREWAAACCRGSAADTVLVAANRAGELLGFAACRVQQDADVHLGRPAATIVLIATAPGARGRGVGRAVVTAALDWAARESVEFMQVGTQIRNGAAARLYENCGFRLVAASQSFRAVIAPRNV